MPDVQRTRLAQCLGLLDSGPEARRAVSGPIGNARYGLRQMEGFVVDDGRLSNRKAAYRLIVSGGAPDDYCRMLHQFRRGEDGDQIVGVWDDGSAEAQLYVLRGNSIASGADWISEYAYLPTGRRHTMTVYAQRAYIANGGPRSGDTIVDTYLPKVWDGNDAFSLFMPQPQLAPDVSQDGEAGTLGAGPHKYCYTFYRSRDGAESPPSPIVTKTWTGSGASRAILTGFRCSDTTQNVVKADQIRIYRSTSGGATFVLLDTITNQGPWRYLDQTPDADLSDVSLQTLSSLNDVQADVVVAHDDRLYLLATREGIRNIERRADATGQTDIISSRESFPSRIRWSQPGDPWNFDALDFDQRWRDQLRAGVSTEAGLILFTRKQAFIAQNRGGIIDALDLGFPGCFGPHAVTRYDGGAIWASPRGVFQIDRFGRGTELSRPAVVDVFRNADVRVFPEVLVAAARRQHRVYVAMPGGQDYPDELLVFQQEFNAWSKQTGQLSTASETVGRVEMGAVAELIDSPGDDKVWVAENGDTNIYELGEVDGWTVSKIRFGPSDLGVPQAKKFVRAVVRFRAEQRVTLTCSSVVDRSLVATSSQTIEASLTEFSETDPIALDGSYSFAMPEYEEAKFSINRDGEELELALTWQRGGGQSAGSEGPRIWDVRVDVFWQEKDDARACG